jgi:hypothetical protein
MNKEATKIEKAREELDAVILKAVQEFETKTGVEAISIDLFRSERGGPAREVVTFIDSLEFLEND